MENFKKPTDLVNYMLEIENKLSEDTPVARLLNEKYKEIEKKLPEDVKELSSQYLLLFGMMLEEAENNPEFAAQLLLPYKTWNRLYKFMDNLCRPKSEIDKTFSPRCAMVDCFTLLFWVKQYYALDDQEDYENELAEKEKAEQTKRELDEKMKKMRNKSSNTSKVSTSKDQSSTQTSIVDDDKENLVKAEIKKSKRDCNGQLDLFSLLKD